MTKIYNLKNSDRQEVALVRTGKLTTPGGKSIILSATLNKDLRWVDTGHSEQYIYQLTAFPVDYYRRFFFSQILQIMSLY